MNYYNISWLWQFHHIYILFSQLYYHRCQYIQSLEPHKLNRRFCPEISLDQRQLYHWVIKGHWEKIKCSCYLLLIKDVELPNISPFFHTPEQLVDVPLLFYYIPRVSLNFLSKWTFSRFSKINTKETYQMNLISTDNIDTE